MHYAGRYSQAGINVKALPAGMFIFKATGFNGRISIFKFVKNQ
jgi:hypothetical protein